MLQHLLEHEQRNVLAVRVLVGEEPAQNIDSERLQGARTLDYEDRPYALVQDGIARVLRAVGDRGNLGEDVRHLIRELPVLVAHRSEKAQDFNLEEGVTDSTDVVLGRVGRNYGLEDAHHGGHKLDKPRLELRLDRKDMLAELQAGDQDPVVPVFKEQL